MWFSHCTELSVCVCVSISTCYKAWAEPHVSRVGIGWTGPPRGPTVTPPPLPLPPPLPPCHRLPPCCCLRYLPTSLLLARLLPVEPCDLCRSALSHDVTSSCTSCFISLFILSCCCLFVLLLFLSSISGFSFDFCFSFSDQTTCCCGGTSTLKAKPAGHTRTLEHSHSQSETQKEPFGSLVLC